MKDVFYIFLQCLSLRMVSFSRVVLPKHVFKAVEKSAIFIALMVIVLKWEINVCHECLCIFCLPSFPHFNEAS